MFSYKECMRRLLVLTLRKYILCGSMLNILSKFKFILTMPNIIILRTSLVESKKCTCGSDVLQLSNITIYLNIKPMFVEISCFHKKKIYSLFILSGLSYSEFLLKLLFELDNNRISINMVLGNKKKVK